MSLLKESPKIPHLYSFVITQMSFKGLFDCGHRCFIAATVLYMQLPVIYSFQGISWICSSSIISKPTGAPKSTPPPLMTTQKKGTGKPGNTGLNDRHYDITEKGTPHITQHILTRTPILYYGTLLFRSHKESHYWARQLDLQMQQCPLNSKENMNNQGGKPVIHSCVVCSNEVLGGSLILKGQSIKWLCTNCKTFFF